VLLPFPKTLAVKNQRGETEEEEKKKRNDKRIKRLRRGSLKFNS
jgi:hypothetical protein